MDLFKIKQELEVLFTEIKTSLNEGILPDLEKVQRFSKLSTQMHLQADDSWSEEAEDFAHIASQLLISAKKENLADCVLLVESLDDAQDFCHRTFRD